MLCVVCKTEMKRMRQTSILECSKCGEIQFSDELMKLKSDAPKTNFKNRLINCKGYNND